MDVGGGVIDVGEGSNIYSYTNNHVHPAGDSTILKIL